MKNLDFTIGCAVVDKKSNDKPLLVLAVTVPFSMFFFKGQIEYLKKAGFDVAVICAPGWDNLEGVKYYPVPMEREISILKDFKSLLLLIKLFLKIRPTIVNVGTPKAGLLVGIAAFVVRVPVRIYTCHGLRLETLQGWKQKILTATEKVAAYCAHKVVCVSNSLRDKFLELSLAKADKVEVIGEGSCNGVDLSRYTNIDLISENETVMQIRNNSKGAVYIGFVGRLTKDKGLNELVEAFNLLKRKFPNLYLMLLGDFEEGDPLAEETRQKIITDERILHLGFIEDTVSYYRLMRILVLPTYREGFGNVIIEAGAMEIPVVASKVTGCIDAVINGETGLLVTPGDSSDIARAIELLLTNQAMATQMGKNARKRIEKYFSQEKVWNNIVNFYNNQLEK